MACGGFNGWPEFAANTRTAARCGPRRRRPGRARGRPRRSAPVPPRATFAIARRRAPAPSRWVTSRRSRRRRHGLGAQVGRAQGRHRPGDAPSPAHPDDVDWPPPAAAGRWPGEVAGKRVQPELGRLRAQLPDALGHPRRRGRQPGAGTAPGRSAPPAASLPRWARAGARLQQRRPPPATPSRPPAAGPARLRRGRPPRVLLAPGTAGGGIVGARPRARPTGIYERRRPLNPA